MRPTVKMNDVKLGTKLIADDKFDCLIAGEGVVVAESNPGLYVPCAKGRHFLDSQIDGETYVGFSLAPPAA